MHPRQTFRVDTVTYFCLLVGILRAGWTGFPLSPRNSAEVVAELLIKSNTTHIIVSSDSGMQNLAAASAKLLDHGREIPAHTAPTFDDLYPGSGAGKLEVMKIHAANLSLDAPCAILHSSGTACLSLSDLLSLFIEFDCL